MEYLIIGVLCSLTSLYYFHEKNLILGGIFLIIVMLTNICTEIRNK